MKPRTRIARNSLISPAPSDCAVKATVLMRRNANSQNMQSNRTEAIATPPSEVASPSRPIAVVETMPISGVVRFATIAGPAMANTCAGVTFDKGGETAPASLALALSTARGAEHPRQQPAGDHAHGA